MLPAEKKKLDEEAAKPDFWNDVENTKKVLKEQKVLSEKMGSYDSLVKSGSVEFTLVADNSKKATLTLSQAAGA